MSSSELEEWKEELILKGHRKKGRMIDEAFEGKATGEKRGEKRRGEERSNRDVSHRVPP